MATLLEHFLQYSVLPPDVSFGKMKTIGFPHLGHVTVVVVLMRMYVLIEVSFFAGLKLAQRNEFG
jgi:hypothetical protein